MANWLTNLRKKPKHMRDNVAFAVSGGFTALVFAVWFFGGVGSSTLAGASDSPHFFQTLFGQFGKQVASIKESIPKPKEAPEVATTTAKSFPESAPAATDSVWSSASGTISSSSAPRQIMIVTTSSTPATTSTSGE